MTCSKHGKEISSSVAGVLWLCLLWETVWERTEEKKLELLLAIAACSTFSTTFPIALFPVLYPVWVAVSAWSLHPVLPRFEELLISWTAR